MQSKDLRGPSAEGVRQTMGHSLTAPSIFGTDPFQSEEVKIRAETKFNLLYSDLASVFNYTVNEHYRPYQDCLTAY